MEGYQDGYQKNRAADQAQSYAAMQRAANVAPKPVNQSCFNNLEDVTGICAAAANRVERAVARLCGEIPCDPSAEAQSSPNGLLEAADRQARDIRGNMERIFKALERLENNLP